LRLPVLFKTANSDAVGGRSFVERPENWAA
jgi:hypothetical protein